ncbi:MAG: substrate-binding periplasmic protein [Pseudomonadota bacterium]
MKPFSLLLALLLLPQQALTGERPEIVIAADQWCPINCSPDSDQPGFMIEIAQAVFAEAGYQVDYQLMPWSRAVVSAREGSVDAIVGAFVGDAPDFVFPENEQGRIGPAALFTRSSSDWVYDGESSLDSVELGAILDYDYGDPLNSYIASNASGYRVQVMTGHSPLEKNIEKLLMGRIDVVVEAEPVFLYKVEDLGVQDKVRHAGNATPRQNAYIAFSPERGSSREYARILSEGMETLRASGRLQRIMARYGLEDWHQDPLDDPDPS